MSMIFRIVLSLLADHKDMLLQCRNMEQLMDYFKTTLPSMGASQLDRVIQQVLLLFTVVYCTTISTISIISSRPNTRLAVFVFSFPYSRPTPIIIFLCSVDNACVFYTVLLSGAVGNWIGYFAPIGCLRGGIPCVTRRDNC